jgi:hypothetical protein
VQLAAEQREQARLPAPVRADHPDPLAGVDGEVCGVEEKLRSAAEAELA